MLRRTLLALILATVPALGAPPEIAPFIHADEPLGAGKYTVLFLTAYDAQLWTDAPHWSMDVPFALTLHYHIGFSPGEIVSRSLAEMKHVDPSLDESALKRYDGEMTRIFPAVADGDEITALYEPGKPVKFFHNGVVLGDISDAPFAADFFGIWLSPRSSAPDLRRALLNLR